jgi:hypothetical protein
MSCQQKLQRLELQLVSSVDGVEGECSFWSPKNDVKD